MPGISEFQAARAPIVRIAGPAARLGIRPMAILELVLILGGLLLIDHVFFDGTRFRDVQPHPFGFLVLLFAVQYGVNEALLATFAATVALIVGNVPEQSLSQDLYAWLFHLAANPILWLVMSLLVGELTSRMRRRIAGLSGDLDGALKREQVLTDAYSRLSEANAGLEARVAAQLRTVVSLYRAAKAIEKLGPGEVLIGIADLVREVMSPQKFSLFLLNGNVLEAVVNEGWEPDDRYARVFDAQSLIFQSVIGRQQFLVAARPQEQRILGGEGLIAGPLVSADTGEIVGMLKIEQSGFIGLHLSAVQNFRMLADWIGTAFANAMRFEEVESDSLMNADRTLLSASLFDRQTTFLTALGRRVGFDVSMLVLTPDMPAALTDDQRVRLSRTVAEAVRAALRTTDLAFEHQRGGFEFAVVLPATDPAGAQLAADKLMSVLTPRLEHEVEGARIAASVHVLHRKEASQVIGRRPGA